MERSGGSGAERSVVALRDAAAMAPTPWAAADTKPPPKGILSKGEQAMKKKQEEAKRKAYSKMAKIMVREIMGDTVDDVVATLARQRTVIKIHPRMRWVSACPEPAHARGAAFRPEPCAVFTAQMNALRELTSLMNDKSHNPPWMAASTATFAIAAAEAGFVKQVERETALLADAEVDAAVAMALKEVAADAEVSATTPRTVLLSAGA